MRVVGPERSIRFFYAAFVGLPVAAFFASCAQQPPVPPEYGLSPGDRLVYEVDYRTASKTDFRVLFDGDDAAAAGATPAPPAGPRSYGTVLRGELVVTVLERDQGKLLCSYEVEHPRVELDIEGSHAPAQAETTAALVGRETFAEMDPRGRLLGVLVPLQADRMTQGFILALLAKTQFVLPADPRAGSRVWTTEEEDPNGRYQGRYEAGASFEGKGVRALSKGLVPFRKTKERYFPAEPVGKQLLPRLPAVVRPSGETEMLFDAKGGFLEAAAGSETERVTVSGREVARVESRMSLRRTGRGAVTSSEHLARLEAFRWRRTVGDFIPLTMAVPEEESEQAIQRTALGQATLESLRAELATAEAAGRRPNTDLYLKFKALVYLHPEFSADLGEQLAEAPATSVTRDIVGGALSVVGHPEAQAALAKAIRSHGNEPGYVLGLIEALAQARFPTESSERTLRDIASGPPEEIVHAAALFGLGTMSRNLKETEPVRAERIVGGLLASIGPPMTERGTDTLLKALGNSGSGKALPVLMEFVKNRSGRLRASAAAGLRFVDSGQADSVLATVLASDEDAQVRMSALLALRFRKPAEETIRAQIQAVSRDEAEAVRLAALTNLGSIVGEFPEVLPVIRRAAEEDDSASVRKTAANILSMRGGERDRRRPSAVEGSRDAGPASV